MRTFFTNHLLLQLLRAFKIGITFQRTKHNNARSTRTLQFVYFHSIKTEPLLLCN